MKNTKFLAVAAACLTVFVGVAHPNIGWTGSIEDKVKESIDNFSKGLKKEVDKVGNDFKAIQHYLDHYHWKGLVEKEATSGAVTLKDFKMNGHSTALVANPGEKINAEVICVLDPEETFLFNQYRVVIGIRGEGAQATLVGTDRGSSNASTKHEFALRAPDQAGIYQICFRDVNTFFEAIALNSWKDEYGNEPGAKTTIGILIVR